MQYVSPLNNLHLSNRLSKKLIRTENMLAIAAMVVESVRVQLASRVGRETESPLSQTNDFQN